jgi:hypothetical protein
VFEEKEYSIALVAVVSEYDVWVSVDAGVPVVSVADVSGLDVLADVTISVV